MWSYLRLLINHVVVGVANQRSVISVEKYLLGKSLRQLFLFVPHEFIMLHLDLLQSQACNKLLDKPLGVTTTIGTAADHGSALGLVQGAGSELGGDFHLCRQGTELASDVELSASARQSRSCWRRINGR